MKNENMILIIEDNPGDALLLQEKLGQIEWPTMNIEVKRSLLEAKEFLQQVKPAIVFLDLNLPDSSGLLTFLALNSIAPDIPIIILSGVNDSAVSVDAVKAGAQDFLVKGEFEDNVLLKTILYGIERKKNQLKIEEANKRYDLISKATNDTIWDWVMSSNEIYWNNKVRIFGYADSTRKDSQWRINNIHPDDRQTVEDKIADCIKSGADSWTCEYRFKCADGTYKFIQDRCYLMVDRNNKPYRMIGTMQDLTEKKLIEEHIDNEKKKQHQAILQATLEGQEKERNYISKELHDNINQILTSAKIYLSMGKDGDEAKNIEKLKTGTSLIQSAINEIRNLTHTMSSSYVEEFGLTDSLETMIENINLQNKCKVKIFKSGDDKFIQPGLALTMFRIVQEQFNNIFKHSKADEATIKLYIEKDKAVLNISDNGIGASLEKNQRPAGIGLSNIYTRVQAYNGNITIRTKPGNGFNLNVEFMF